MNKNKCPKISSWTFCSGLSNNHGKTFILHHLNQDTEEVYLLLLILLLYRSSFLFCGSESTFSWRSFWFFLSSIFWYFRSSYWKRKEIGRIKPCFVCWTILFETATTNFCSWSNFQCWLQAEELGKPFTHFQYLNLSSPIFIF